ncbi:MAG TPA: AmmeMemoRadiSam system protein B [bacterium]|nr:AmmeMemoRadiSam system protein B [bacterium]
MAALSTVRRPAVAGTFYPADPAALSVDLDRCLANATLAKTSCTAIIVPHAGYRYSGAVAGEVYGRVELPRRFIILSPNHTGHGVPYSLMSSGEWRTPLGNAAIDADLAARFQAHCPLLQNDAAAHRAEHSLEVQIPFLQKLKPGFTFVPLTLGYLPFEKCEAVGHALAETIRETPEPVMIVASSDMNHYEDQETTEEKDFWAIGQIEAMNPKGLYQTVRDEKISMCGIIPTTVALVAALALGAKEAKLIRHATSGDVTGDYGAVVGYAGFVIR